MKYLFTFFLLLTVFTISSQEKNGFYYKLSLASTLTINEDFTIGNDEGETLINPSAIFINNTIGFKLDQKSSVGLNIEYDWYSKQGLHFLPIYFSFRYNIFEYEDNIFLRSGYGRLISLSKYFENGTMYKIGLGFEIFDDDYENSLLIGLDFNRKRFGYRQLEKISSVAIFLEYIF